MRVRRVSHFTRSDSFKVTVRSTDEEHFKTAMSLVFAERSFATHFIKTEHELILFWHPPTGGPAQPLPYPMNGLAATPFVWNWLFSGEYPPDPDTDGSVKKGFAVSTEVTVDGRFYAICSIKREWAIYGK